MDGLLLLSVKYSFFVYLEDVCHWEGDLMTLQEIEWAVCKETAG